jgi:hypothetical protein
MILSLHYPKTAGTSFRHTLTKLYYGNIYFHYHGAHMNKNLKVRGEYDKIEIVHGHFNIKSYREMFPDAPIITWLRDPAERVLSYYNYKKYGFTSTPRIKDSNNRQFLAFLDSGQFEFFVNKFDRFFGDYTTKDFLFIGITERYNEDMKKLAKMMGWGGYQVHHLNKSRNYENVVLTKELRERIYRKMSREYEMYLEVKG